MSQPCTIDTCKRISRALCHCCQKNLCIIHLNEHNDLLNSQLNPLTDEINALSERLEILNAEHVLDNYHQELEQWRQECYKKIDHFVAEKRQELDHFVAQKLDKQKEEVIRMRSMLDKLIRDEEVTRQDIETLTSTIRQIENEIHKIEQSCFSIDIRPLLINESIVQIKEICAQQFDPSTLSLVYKTITSPPGSWFSLTSNGRLLLIHQEPNLCFVNAELTIIKQVLWPHDVISDICWSSTLDRFIVIVKDSIFLVDENTMSIESVETVEKRNWISCTCFKEQLFLSTEEWGSSIVEVNFSPRIAVIKEWKSPVTCTMDEYIGDMVYNNKRLAVVISNEVQKSIRMELRSCTMLDCLWSLPLDIVYLRGSFRCCSLTCNGWLVEDHIVGRLLHITADGNLKETIAYKEIPHCITLFGSNMLAIATEQGINFHKI